MSDQTGNASSSNMSASAEANSTEDALFRIGIELGRSIVAKVDLVSGSDGEELAYKGAMLFFFCKAYKTYQAAYVLHREGFSEDAFILARTVFELALQARYMKEDPKPHARLFTEFDPVARYRYYLRLRDLGVTDEIQKFKTHQHELKLDEMKQYYDRLHNVYPANKGWWGESIYWLAKHLGKEMEKRYVAVYWMQSNLVHSGTSAVKEYLREHEGGLQINCSPSKTDRTMPAQEITLFFLDVAGHVAEALELNLNDSVSKALEKFRSILGIAPEL